jgi:putative Holliday junction resolvase
MKVGRRIAFDYGDVRIGVAMSDPHGILVSPAGVIEAQSETLRSEIATLISEFEPIYIVVGNPLHLSGQASAKQEQVQGFLALLAELTDLPLILVDERLSTSSAAKKLQSAGINARGARSKIDAAAAVAILERAMEQERLTGMINGVKP